ncbi:hypothetical protein B0I35DRAFT_472895 [Stachybotrys elegans]|uniref:Uncharacterized protein n=1 Tax=Stachybotrys elegans TaxID=80388 RepID=A0A8K0T6S3_9HYPO|nr:hypothetical protein B0I35DRAFT_472895 [Stachybotrys elegans]
MVPGQPRTKGLHIHLRDQCGLCGVLLIPGDYFVVLYAGRDQTLAGYVAFPNYLHYPEQCSKVFFCRQPISRKCADRRESATLHTDCYNLYMQHAKSPDKASRLYTFASWNHPWPKCAPLLLSPLPFNLERASHLAAQVCSIPGLTTLPPEVSQMIWDWATPTVLLRFCAVLDAVDFLDHAPSHSRAFMPLATIHHWERGSFPVDFKAPDDSDFRITIDSRGIRRIDRLETGQPNPVQRKGSDIVYAIAKASQPIRVLFHLGLARLALDNTQLQLWDIPTPLQLPEIHALDMVPGAASLLPSARIATIDLETCTGITFFVCGGHVSGMHAHTSFAPSAQDTFHRFSAFFKASYVWVYVPLPRADAITAFGVLYRSSGQRPAEPCYLIRTKLAGDLTIGTLAENHEVELVPYPVTPQSVLVHTVPDRPTNTSDVILLGAHPTTEEQGQFLPIISTHLPLSGAAYSTAVLENVACVWVFRDRFKTALLRGLLVEYNNGAQRALGDCRLHVAPTEKCSELECLAFASTTVNGGAGTTVKAVKVVVLPSSSDAADGLDETWTRCSEGNTLEIWVTERELVLDLTTADGEDSEGSEDSED